MAKDPELRAHQEWLGYLQPVGLVVSPPALLAAQAYVNRNIIPEQERFLAVVQQVPVGAEEPGAAVVDFPRFAREVLDWRATDLVGGPDAERLADDLEVVLPEYGETLRPTYGVREFIPQRERKQGETAPWLMLIQTLAVGTAFDEVAVRDEHRWHASPHSRFERMLRELEVPTGLLVNGTHIRLVYAPRGETSGHLTFPVHAMTEVAGRPIFAACHMLLSADRLFIVEPKQRLTAILAESRKYQNIVSTQLAQQVLAALYELLRGFQAANEQRKGELLREVLARDPDLVYKGLLTVLMRLVFVLYAEDRGLMPGDPLYVRHYSIGGLFERLREDEGRYPDTMDLRYGSWPQLLTLFRLVFDGASHGKIKLPRRRGYLFDPDRYPFLEGRSPGSTRQAGEKLDPPLVSDGVIFRVLHNLLVVDGERISYRTLDVEQIGSVYETIMGFSLEVARGRSIAIKPAKTHGAPSSINLDELLTQKAEQRGKWLVEHGDAKLDGKALAALKAATTPEAVVAALERKVARDATPNIVPPGAMVLQPSDERRRSGSHYTPRSLTAPIVQKTLEPVLKQLGERPKPDQILDLKVCDPAMGSGAFLVEVCRQLSEELVKAWQFHKRMPVIPPDEDELLHARRLVAQSCLYGVDKNPMAADLAKLSLWLATLARDHDFTFLDHALRCGDSLVGLTREQILAFHWKPTGQKSLWHGLLSEHLQAASKVRTELRALDDWIPYEQKRAKLVDADKALDLIRLAGDLVVEAHFSSAKEKDRLNQLALHSAHLGSWLGEKQDFAARQQLDAAVKGLHAPPHPINSFHWEIEFPEVFGRDKPGFDAFVGNPPFLGGKRISTNFGDGYRDWLAALHEETNSSADLVAHFFRRAFGLLRQAGTFGLIATNTIGQGDTRSTGLRWICSRPTDKLPPRGIIYAARRRLKWPGLAAVVVSVVNVLKGILDPPFELDDRSVDRITAYLFHAGTSDDPARLTANVRKSFIGCYVLGMGFTFDDIDTKEVASSLADMHRILAIDNTPNPPYQERIFPYIGGEEVNDSPTQAAHRFVIDFFDLPLSEADRWPRLIEIVREKVKPERDRQKRKALRERWWQYADKRPALRRATSHLEKVLVCTLHQPHWCLTQSVAKVIFSHALAVFALPTNAAFCTLQCRVHEIWARFFGSSMKDDLRYTPSDCFETFPFPPAFETDPMLEATGNTYYEFRAALMIENNEGLTETYNRFHDPNEKSPKLQSLRDLHAAMDRAVLDAYGWTDFTPRCEFLLDYEEDEDEEDEGKARRRKKPYRYRWVDEDRDWVLAKLLELNQQRAKEERMSGQAPPALEAQDAADEDD